MTNIPKNLKKQSKDQVELNDDINEVYSRAEFFHHHWPIMLFAGFFVIMVSVPMILTGFLQVQGLGIIAAFLIGLGIALTSAQFLGVFLLACLVIISIAAPEHTYNDAGYFLTALLTISFLFGVTVFIRPKLKRSDTQAEVLPTITQVQDEVAEEAPEEDEKPAYKPVAFDKTIAAEGLTIVFGTESGNCEDLAKNAAEAAKAEGINVQVLDASVVDARHLEAFANLFVITSTWGDGDPPSNAVDLVEAMESGIKIDMSGAQFSVCSLGDTSYEQFCKCGKDFDSAMEKYGAERVAKRVDCDVDFEEPFKGWIADAVSALKSKGLKKKAEYVEPVFEEATVDAAAAPA